MKTNRAVKCGSIIIELGNRWRRAISFTAWFLYVYANSFRYPLARNVCDLLIWSERCGEEKNHFSLPVIEYRPSSPRSITALSLL
jgi:hypothetical protein